MAYTTTTLTFLQTLDKTYTTTMFAYPSWKRTNGVATPSISAESAQSQGSAPAEASVVWVTVSTPTPDPSRTLHAETAMHRPRDGVGGAQMQMQMQMQRPRQAYSPSPTTLLPTLFANPQNPYTSAETPPPQWPRIGSIPSEADIPKQWRATFESHARTQQWAVFGALCAVFVAGVLGVLALGVWRSCVRGGWAWCGRDEGRDEGRAGVDKGKAGEGGLDFTRV